MWLCTWHMNVISSILSQTTHTVRVLIIRLILTNIGEVISNLNQIIKQFKLGSVKWVHLQWNMKQMTTLIHSTEERILNQHPNFIIQFVQINSNRFNQMKTCLSWQVFVSLVISLMILMESAAISSNI